MAVNGLGSLVQLLIYIVICGLIIYGIIWILSLIALPPPVRTIISVVIGLIVVLWLLATLGVIPRMW